MSFVRSLSLALSLTFLAPLVQAQEPPKAPAVPSTPIAQALEKAETLFKAQNWAEARAEYDRARDLKTDWRDAGVRLAVEGAVSSSLKLKQWDDAIARATQYVEKTQGSYEGAVGERFLAGLYLMVPHEGTKRGSTYLRGQYAQGVRVSSWRKDRQAAISHYEIARFTLLALQNSPQTDATLRRVLLLEQVGVDFDMSGALTQRTSYRYGYNRWGWWSWWWPANLEDEEDSDAVEEADYEEPRYGWGYENSEENTPPTGLPLDANGKPQFVEVPAQYSPKLADGPKIRFLLDEIQRIDPTEKKENAAKALFRWAMITRSLYGPEAVAQWNQTRVNYDRLGRPLPQQKEAGPQKEVWELGPDQSLTLVNGRLDVVDLPPTESPLALLRQVAQKYPQSSWVPEANYASGLYLQTRQQFPQAMAVYSALIEAFPKHDRADAAKTQIRLITTPSVALDKSGVHLPGGQPRLAFSYQNTDQVTFKAMRFDLAKYVQDAMQTTPKNSYWDYRNISYSLFYGEKEPWKKYLGAQVAAWKESVPLPAGNRIAQGSTQAPLSLPGAYIVEAGIVGRTEITRVLVLVTDIAIVQKNLAKKGLIWLADARSGQPLAGKAVRIYEHWTESKDSKQFARWDSTIQTTNKDGVIEYTRRHADQGSQIDAVTSGADWRMAFSFFQNWSEYDYGNEQENGSRLYVITDRPVYRPGSLVKFRFWLRRRENGNFIQPKAGEDISLSLYDTKNIALKTFSLKTDEWGGADAEYLLGEEPPLGIYRLSGGYNSIAGGVFRVEEYKKPEFEVTVTSAKTQARLGEKIRAQISARYYFGSPVAAGQVTYKVFREKYNHVFLGEGEYDWLYGAGYGRYFYAYPWLPWWGRWGRSSYWNEWRALAYPNYSYWINSRYDFDYARRMESGTRKALRELVAQGTATLKPDGTYEVEIDTSRAAAELSDSDHRYTIEAEVRDASRRTITGQGSLLATRQQFSAFVETDGGWYQPKNQAFVKVRTLTPDNVPVAVQGQVVVSRIQHSASGSNSRETEVTRWSTATDAQGRLSFKYPIPSEGQYRITFVTSDSWKQEVQGNAVFWVNGPKFDGRVYRFNDLEVIADKRTYKVGDTAHLLINTAEPNSRVMWSDEVGTNNLRSYRFFDIPGHTKVIDVPITASQVPNFFVEATLVRNGRVHTESQELFVPPVQGLLNVSVKTDKSSYKAGEKGRVQVAVTDANGQPVRGQVTLTAYDQAVTYIQDEFGPTPKQYFYGQKRAHSPSVDASFDETFNATGGISAAQGAVYVGGGEPESWRGSWRPENAGLTLGGDMDFDGRDFLESRVTALENRMSPPRVLATGLDSVYSSGGFGGGLAYARAGASVGGFGSVTEGYLPMIGSLGRKRTKIAAGLLYDDDLGLGDAQKPLIDPQIRTNFADTALWMPSLTLDEKGRAETEITFPQSLTNWKLHGYALTNSTQVGDATAQANTSKNLLVRLQSPRFFVERDEVTLSANVHNYLKTGKNVRAELIVPAELFATLDGEQGKPDSDGNLHLPTHKTVAANGETRFDWPVKVLKSGFARITVKALTDEESDGMRLAFPVLVHGSDKTVAQSGVYRVNQEGSRDLQIDLPQQIDATQTRLDITLSPSLSGVMVDALPYLVGYPYGCVEQTMSRFYPSVLVKDSLKKMGTNLETIGKQRRQMNQGDLKNRFERAESPVYDSKELDAMVQAGLQRIANFQRPDGGWGWWREDDSSPYQTAYVLQGLKAARDAGVKVDDNLFRRGMQYLWGTVEEQLEKPKEQRQIGSFQTQAYIAYILSFDSNARFNNEEQNKKQSKWLDDLFAARGDLNNYGRALLALAMKNNNRPDDAQLLLRNLLQFVERDDSNETAWVRTPGDYWWFWWNNDIETNAWALKALVAIDPQNDLAPRLVKWLLNNRKNGYYWRSTRDTAQVISAMTDYMKASGEAAPDYTLTVNVDGKPLRELKIDKTNFFTFENRLSLSGLEIPPGPHRITFSKKGQGALYYSAYLSYFTQEEDSKGAGNEIFVERKYFKLIPRTETVSLPVKSPIPYRPASKTTASGRTELRDGFIRVPLNIGDAVKSGDQIEVVLNITAKNSYDYLAFEDMKPAGCEPVELRSGGRWAGGLVANVELRDEKVVFFIGLLEQGQHVLRYKLRAETPGQFHVLPTKGFAMYAPEVKGISDEMRLKIQD